MNRRALRRFKSNAMVALMIAAVIVAVLPLLLILVSLVARGAGSLSLAFFTRMPVPAGETGGGVLHAIVGTLIIVGIASLMGVPIGMGAGLYCVEYPGSRISWITRFVSDVLNGTPSIVVGVFAWTIVVKPQQHYSAFAGSIALAILMIPMITRSTKELIKLVPNSLREAALALGYARWRTSLTIVLRTALPGIVTGSLLAIARIAGETAPLLLTALGNQFFSVDPSAPMAALPLVVFKYATGPYEEWHQFAWAAALVLIMVVLALSIAARIVTRRRFEVPVADEAPVRVRTRNLTAYYDTTPAVKTVSLQFAANQVHALIGPSGCGKSTFLRSLNRMHEMSPGGSVTGQVHLDSENIYAPEVSVIQLRRRVGMVFQKPTPFPTKSIYDNVAAGLMLAGKRPRAELDGIVERSLQRAALWDEVKDRLHGSALALSGGQQQRLCLARTIAPEPEVILLDEPTASLDPQGTQRIEELVFELKRDFTIIIVTHNMQQAARVSDTTSFFYLGTLIEHGPTKQIFTMPQEEQTEAYITGRFG